MSLVKEEEEQQQQDEEEEEEEIDFLLVSDCWQQTTKQERCCWRTYLKFIVTDVVSPTASNYIIAVNNIINTVTGVNADVCLLQLMKWTRLTSGVVAMKMATLCK